jgi:hypothetical protein
MFEELIQTLCPQCAEAVRAVVKRVQDAAVAEAQARHEANKLAAEQRVSSTLGEAEAVLKGKR